MQWEHPSSLLLNKAKVVSSARKVMAKVFFFFWDVKSIVFIDYFQVGHTINEEYYPNLLRPLWKAIKTKHEGKLTKGVPFHQDSTSTHKSLLAIAVVHDCGFELVDYPNFSPGLDLSDNHLFPNIKSFGWEPTLKWWWCHICCWWQFFC